MNNIHKELQKLLKKSGTINNLSANVGIVPSTLKYLLDKPEAWPSPSVAERLKPFIDGDKKIEQIKRPYRRKKCQS